MSASTISALERLQQIEPPLELSRQALWEAVGPAMLSENLGLQEIISILKSQEFREEVRAGKVTVGMIKPRLEEAVKDGTVQTVKDWERAQEIINIISSQIDTILQISVQFTEPMVEEFYAGKPKEAQLQNPPINPDRYGQRHENRWQEFMALMTSAPVTFLILAKEDGTAIDTWRQMLGGSWDINQAKPGSLRATYPHENHNNIFHGSDSPESVLKELDFLIAYLEQCLS